ncbi:MAG: glycosyltransferase [Candidatus Altarchaeum sp.]|nr:glycosyltransferase [Candidatus Altarchaeum sp.]
MKICFFTDTYFPQVNGVTYTIDLWKNELAKIYGKENIFVFYPKSEYKGSTNEISLPSVKFPLYEGYKISLPSAKLLNINLDIVHIHGLYSSAVFGISVAKQLKIPCIITYHTPTHLYTHYATNLISRHFSESSTKKISGILRKGLMMWEKFVLKSCDLITVPSNVIAEYLKEQGIDNVRVISNGIDINLFKEDFISRKFRQKKNEKCIGYCGRIGLEKHLEDLIYLADKFNGEILIAGEGPAKKYYNKLADKISNNIKFSGRIPHEELPKFYSSLDFLVFPSVVETQGLVALESMACGTPVIGADALALKETIINGKTGYLYKPEDVDELFMKLEIAYQNREILAGNCVAEAMKHSVENTVNALRKIYEGIKTRK